MNKATTKAIDQEGVKKRVQEAVEALQTAPIGKQRPIFANVIHFAELHPTKVRLGLYAPLAMRAGSTTVQNNARRETRLLDVIASASEATFGHALKDQTIVLLIRLHEGCFGLKASQ